MSFLTSTRVVRTALASAALLMLGTVAAPAANAYNPDIDGDGIPNTWEMKGYDADGDAGDVRILCSEGRVGEALEVLAEQSDPKGKVAELASCISKRLHHRHAGAFPRHHGGR